MINLVFWKFDKKYLLKTSKFILIICIIIFSGKQLQRYIKNYNSNFIWPRIYSFETNQKIDSKKIFFDENFTIYKSDDACMYNNSPCSNYDLKKNLSIVKKYSYYFVNIKN